MLWQSSPEGPIATVAKAIMPPAEPLSHDPRVAEYVLPLKWLLAPSRNRSAPLVRHLRCTEPPEEREQSSEKYAANPHLFLRGRRRQGGIRQPVGY